MISISNRILGFLSAVAYDLSWHELGDMSIHEKRMNIVKIWTYIQM